MTNTLPLPATLWDLVVARAELTPDKRFLTDDQGGSLTFAEFREKAEAIAAGLYGAGLRPGQTVSWQLPTTFDAAALMVALSRLVVIQNPIIHILRQNEVGFIVDQLGTDWLITPGIWRNFDFDAMATGIATTADHPVRLLSSAGGLPTDDPHTLPDFDTIRGAPDAVASVYFSSGSTGRPKGARHTELSVMNGANAFISNVRVAHDDVVPIAFPITHIGGPTLLTGVLRVGAEIMCIAAFDPVASSQAMADAGATMLGSALPFFQSFLAAQAAHGAEPLFDQLRVCTAGGAPLPPEMHYQLRDQLGGRGVVNGWGLTEFPIATFSSIDDPDEILATTVGRVAPGVSVKIVKLDGQLAATGEEGEILVDGPQKFLGYLDGSLDADAFDADGFFRSGDLGSIDEHGYIRITGRLKDVIIRKAENISALEVENALFTHPSIADIAVVGLPDVASGERVCAVVVLADGVNELALQSVAEHCRSLGLASQKIPEQIEIVDELPRNPQGKILKFVLRDRMIER